MPMQVNWYDDEKTIVKVDIPRDSTWDEYYEIIEWIVREVHTVEHRVDMIFYEEFGMPRGNPLPHIKWGTKKIIDIPNSGHTIVVSSHKGSNMFGQMIMNTLAKLFMASEPIDESKSLIFVSDMESALEQINKARSGTNIT